MRTGWGCVVKDEEAKSPGGGWDEQVDDHQIQPGTQVTGGGELLAGKLEIAEKWANQRPSASQVGVIDTP